MNERRFTWLHLTDVHVGMSIERTRWANIEHLVLTDLDRVVRFTGPIDMILFTGDLTQKGHASEYLAFDEVLQTIRGRLLEHGSAPVFVAVPGNHDLRRPSERITTVQALKGWSTNADVRDGFWHDPGSAYRKMVRAAFKDWIAWSEHAIDWASLVDVRYGLLPGDFSASWINEHRDLRVGIVGLNTAALQLTAGDYQGRLSLSATQLDPLLPKPDEWAKSHDIVFLLTHHDPSWLDSSAYDEYRSEIAPVGRFPLHLCGHRHVADRTQIQHGSDEPRRIQIGSALFGLEWFQGVDPHGQAGTRVDRMHGYTVGQITFGRTRLMRLWPRGQERGKSGQWLIQSERGEQVENDQGTRAQDIGASPRALSRPGGQVDHGRVEDDFPTDDDCYISSEVIRQLTQVRAPDLEMLHRFEAAPTAENVVLTLLRSRQLRLISSRGVRVPIYRSSFILCFVVPELPTDVQAIHIESRDGDILSTLLWSPTMTPIDLGVAIGRVLAHAKSYPGDAAFQFGSTLRHLALTLKVGLANKADSVLGPIQQFFPPQWAITDFGIESTGPSRRRIDSAALGATNWMSYVEGLPWIDVASFQSALETAKALRAKKRY